MVTRFGIEPRVGETQERTVEVTLVVGSKFPCCSFAIRHRATHRGQSSCISIVMPCGSGASKTVTPSSSRSIYDYF